MKYAGPQTNLLLFLKHPYTVSEGECGAPLVLASYGIISCTKG
jgi:hypothetical protein